MSIENLEQIEIEKNLRYEMRSALGLTCQKCSDDISWTFHVLVYDKRMRTEYYISVGNSSLQQQQKTRRARRKKSTRPAYHR